MSHKVQKKYSLSIQGVVEISDGHITILVEDKGEYDLADLMSAFNGNDCKISVSYDEEYGNSVEVNAEISEIIEDI